MDQERPKRRKCGPRVKTGCITCRIRRVKCDEGKPNCQRCVSTGRKCDGYVTQQKSASNRSQLRPNDGALEVVRSPGTSLITPVDHIEDQRSRQLFQFYCVKSAFDLSVYLNSSFWHDMILQYSQYHPVIRQAVVAFGSSHLYALSANQSKPGTEVSVNDLEQARQYDLAIRSLREYMTSDNRPDPHVILICCALFFSCENARGNREAAWQHLENGLHILKSVEGHKSKKLLTGGNEVTTELELVASKNGSKLKAKTNKVDIDEELIYVFSRLDVQATLCQEKRKPVLNLLELSNPASSSLPHTTTFSTITDAQRSLDHIHNRLARFLSSATTAKPQLLSLSTPEPDWVETERAGLNALCASWESSMRSFVENQQASVKQHLQLKHASKLPNSPEWQLALQIQLLTLHHRCWWMLFRSYHNPSTFTMSPNPRAAEILDICEFLGLSLPLRASVLFNTAEIDLAWKMISEIGVTAPLFVLSTKCTDANIKSRAIAQLKALRLNGNGIYHETFLDEVIKVITHPPDQDRRGSIASTSNESVSEMTLHQLRQSMTTPGSDYESTVDSLVHSSVTSYQEVGTDEQDAGGLLGWSNASSAA